MIRQDRLLRQTQPVDAIAQKPYPARRLKVLMVSDVCHPRVNGVSTSIETFSGALSRLGLRITLVAPDYPGANPAVDTAAASCADVLRIPSRAVPFDPEDRLMHWGDLAALDRRLASADFDLVHVQTPFAAHYAGMRFARKRGIPCVATYHTHFEEYLFHYIRILPRAVLRLASRGLARHQCNSLDAVVVPSNPMAETLQSYGVSVPLHVIPTGLPDSQFLRGNGARFRQHWGIAPTRKIALFVGRAAFEKSIDFLLDVITIARRKLPHLMLVVAGEGPALAALRRQAEALRIDDHVRFVGYLPRHDGLRDCYAAADIFTFASKTETQGLVLLEAMAIGLPVLAIPALGAAEIINPACGALPGADTPAAFASQLVELLGAPDRLAAMSGEAIRFARQWDAGSQAVRLASLYRSLLRTPVAAIGQQTVAAPR
ncbi:MAG: glycosyltransferase [Rhodocyclales bacterium]|nr:glycosyltransferase [Rhodocyclales bacterium]